MIEPLDRVKSEGVNQQLSAMVRVQSLRRGDLLELQ